MPASLNDISHKIAALATLQSKNAEIDTSLAAVLDATHRARVVLAQEWQAAIKAVKDSNPDALVSRIVHISEEHLQALQRTISHTRRDLLQSNEKEQQG